MVDLGRLWLVGAGNMGGALRGRWDAAGFAPVVIDPALGAGIPRDGAPDILVLAVKPQVWHAATAAVAARVAPGVLVVSVMAGVTLAALAARFPAAACARAMPNTPSGVGRGIAGLFMAFDDPTSRARLDALFAPAGATVWLDAETDFDAVTAVSGSGPAYVFAFIEALAAAGETAGLAPALALRLARATVTGAAALADGDAAPARLREAVTSPGGTTAAGLDVLLPSLGGLLRETVLAAAMRSRELGK